MALPFNLVVAFAAACPTSSVSSTRQSTLEALCHWGARAFDVQTVLIELGVNQCGILVGCSGTSRGLHGQYCKKSRETHHFSVVIETVDSICNGSLGYSSS